MPRYETVETIFNMLSGADHRNAYFLDLDGTLIDIADRPEDVEVASDLESVLQCLSNRSGGALAIITGRDRAFVDRIFPDLKPAMAASHGAVIREQPGGPVENQVPDINTAALARDLRFAVQHHAFRGGLWVEEKDFACAIHWRQSPLPEGRAENAAREAANAVVQGYNKDKDESAQLALTKGDQVIEIGPRGATKAHVIEKFMDAAPFAGRRPVFFEDSEAGKSAMEVVKNLRGLAIGVGPATDGTADVLLPSPDHARRTLRTIVDKGPAPEGAM